MLMHQGIGLDTFNDMPRGRAVHALFECCCCVTWAGKMADARPFSSHEELLMHSDLELLEFSQQDLDRVFDSCAHCDIGDYTVENLAKVTRSRISRMLGPEGGWPEF